MSHRKCRHMRGKSMGAIPLFFGADDDVFPIKSIEIMESESHVSKQGCAQCGFVNAEWNGSYNKISISPKKAMSPSPTRNNSLNLSQQSSSSQRLSFEGVGGNTSIPDPVDMHQQISELEFQLRKLAKEKSDLLDQLLAKEDEIVSLQCQRDDSEKKQNLNRWNIEKHRQLSTELDETKNSLTILEDANTLLSSKLHQLEKENVELIESKDSTARDVLAKNIFILTQLELCRKQLQVRKTEFSILEDELKEELKHLYSKKTECEMEIAVLKSKLSHLEATNEQLLRDNIELKSQAKICQSDQNEFTSFKSLNETFGVEDDTSASNNEEQANSFSFPNPCPSCKINKNSLHAELFTVFMKKDLLSEQANLRKLSEILRVLQSLRQYFVTSSSNNHEVVFIEKAEIPVVEKPITEPEIEPSNELIKAQITQNDIDTAREDVVRRINEELAEFREQLKMSQELFHALSNSAQNVNVTQSCPLLSETDNPKFVDCSTQTAVINETQHSSFYITNHCHDMDNDMEGQEDDKLSDDISYRLTINLPTVLEESEQETEASPAAVPKMSSKKGNRRLVRGNATEDDKAEEDLKSDNEYASAVSSPPSSKTASVYNSLERPLHVSGTLGIGSSPRRETDTASIVSGGSETTFGSPLSSPSSPTYWTPSQGSSSQETITNHDGDKTPVNEDYGNGAEFDGFPNSSSSNGIGQTASSWTLPKNNLHGDYHIKGVIPETDREYMIAYAYDPPRRVSEPPASILDGEQWRTLKHDLDRETQEKYTKDFAQEEGHDGDSGLHYYDLDEEAEEYFEKFPKLVENLFVSLDNIKAKDGSLTESQMNDISKRFQNLAQMFKTEHTTMSQRFELKKTEHENSRRRMKDICSKIKSSIQNSERLTKSQKPPDESTEVLLSLKDTSQELENHYITLSRTARRLGMLDVEKRMYKMIEVMVLYVHILKNLYENLNKEYIVNRKLLEQHNISVNSGQSLGQPHNNNNGVVHSIESEDHYDTSEVFEDSTKPKKILEELLGRDEKKNLRKRLVLRENRSSNNVVVRYVAESYEVFRRELYWPWSWDTTWKGIKQGFSIILMLVGLFIILKSLFPAVSANDCTPVFDLAAVFSKHGSLSHNHPPPI